jgi:hypothetical protein
LTEQPRKTKNHYLYRIKKPLLNFKGDSAVIFEDISKSIRSHHEPTPDEPTHDSEQILNEEQKPLFEVNFFVFFR